MSIRPPLATAVLAALLIAGCGGGDAWPASTDLAEVLVEAASEVDGTAVGGSPARRAVRDSLRHALVADRKYAVKLDSLSYRPELHGYLFRDESYVGGTFPQSTASLLREAHELEVEYQVAVREFREVLTRNVAKVDAPAEERAAVVADLAGVFESKRKPLLDAIDVHREFLGAAAELYELMAAQPKSFVAKRDGLKFSDASLREEFEAQVDVVNAARDKVEAALKSLNSDQRLALYWIRVPDRIRQ